MTAQQQVALVTGASSGRLGWPHGCPGVAQETLDLAHLPASGWLAGDHSSHRALDGSARVRRRSTKGDPQGPAGRAVERKPGHYLPSFVRRADGGGSATLLRAIDDGLQSDSGRP